MLFVHPLHHFSSLSPISILSLARVYDAPVALFSTPGSSPGDANERENPDKREAELERPNMVFGGKVILTKRDRPSADRVTCLPGKENLLLREMVDELVGGIKEVTVKPRDSALTIKRKPGIKL